jgi:hypothetical protein
MRRDQDGDSYYDRQPETQLDAFREEIDVHQAPDTPPEGYHGKSDYYGEQYLVPGFHLAYSLEHISYLQLFYLKFNAIIKDD